MTKPGAFGYVLGIPENVSNWGDLSRTKGGIWAPLELVVAPQYRANFMFMGLVDSTYGVRISLYKHDLTREYVNVDAEGRLYEYAGREDEYTLLSLEQAKSRLVSQLRNSIDEGVNISLDSSALWQKIAGLLDDADQPIPGLRGSSRKRPGS